MSAISDLTDAVKANSASVDALAARIAALPPTVSDAELQALTAELAAAKVKIDAIAPAA
jgi:hypothetical protein